MTTSQKNSDIGRCKKIMSDEGKSKKKNIAIVSSVCAFIGILIIVIGLIAIVGPEYRKYNFTPKNWSQCEEKQRYKMVKNLEKKYDLIGLYEDEVKELLGRPNTSLKTNGELEAYEYNLSKEGRTWTVLVLIFDNGRVYDTAVMESMR